jgi:hypothetical protein
MKLIKLNSPTLEGLNNSRAQFTAYFQEDIILKPFSKIALRNIQMTTKAIDDIVAGMRLRVSLKDNLNGSKNWKDVFVPSLETSGEDLQYILYGALNSTFSIPDCPLIRTGVHNRIMFETDYNDVNKFIISFKFIEDYYNTNLTTNDNIQYNDTTLAYTKSGNFDNWDYISSGNLPLCLGTGALRFTLGGSTTGSNGCAIGIIQGLDEDNQPYTTPDDSQFYYKVYTQGGTYWYKTYGNVAVDTDVSALENDYVEILIQEGLFILYIRDSVINTQQINFTQNNENTNDEYTKPQYYAYFGLLNENSVFKDILWTQNPFFSSNETGIIKLPLPIPHVVVNSVSDAVPSTISLDFLQGFGQILGFNNVYYDLTGVSGSFIGDLSVNEVRLPDGFYVVLDNIRLTSYDYNLVPKSGGVGRRKSILANICSYDYLAKYNLITYETDAPSFIDMDNKEPITLNTISISVYDNDNNLVELGEIDSAFVTTKNGCPLKLTILVD